MEVSGRRARSGPCPCGRNAPLAECCLPWEEAFQRLAARLVRHAEGPRPRAHADQAAAVFWNAEPPRRPPTHGAFGGRLHFLEWLLHEYQPSRAGVPELARFAEEASGLSPAEETLLLDLLLCPVRVYEAAAPREGRGLLLRDVLAGTEQLVGPLALRARLIRGDLLIGRLLPAGRLLRPGLSLLLLPGTAREELVAYLRTAYRLARTGRHVAFEDYLETSSYLFHHFHLLRGRALGGRVEETVRPFAYAPRELLWGSADPARVRAVLDRQPDLEPTPAAGPREYRWVERASGCVRASLHLSPAGLRIRADTAEDAAEIRRQVGEWLRGLLEGAPEERLSPEPDEGEAAADGTRGYGRDFMRRLLDRWADAPHPALGDRSPRRACGTRRGREQVEKLLAGLERRLARRRRQGQAWAEVGGLRELLGLGPAPSGASSAARAAACGGTG